MKKTTLFIIIIIITIFGFSNMLMAGQQSDFHAHHLGGFVGMASNTDAHHTDFTLGADYEYRLPIFGHKTGVGLIADFVFAEHRETILAVSFIYHPTGNVKLLLAPGLAFAEEHGHSAEHFIWRLGSAYDFHVGQYSISPTLNFDFIEKHLVLAYGITFGLGF